MHRQPTFSYKSFARFAAALLAASVVSFSPSGASAKMTIYQNEALAQLQCPQDEVVWLDFSKRRYYVRGQRLYDRGRTGVFVCRKEARDSGYRRSKLGLR